MNRWRARPASEGDLMRRRRRVAMGLAIGVLLAAEAGAQSPEVTIRVGDRVRYRIEGGDRAKAAVIATSEDWLRVEDESGTSRLIEKAELSSLAVAHGKRRHTLEGALIGGLVGIGLGWGLDELLCEASQCEDQRGVPILGTCGLALGGLAGTLITTDRWEEAPLSRVRFGLAPTRGGGLRATVSLRF
jgi:hypothetical protein